MSKVRLDFEPPAFEKLDPVVFKKFVRMEDDTIVAVKFEINLYSHNQRLLQYDIQVPLQHPTQKQSPYQAVRDAVDALQGSLTESVLFLERDFLDRVDKLSEH